MSVTISIINYRTAQLTEASIRSALAALRGHEGMVVVIDNASGDGSAERLEAFIAHLGPGAPVRLVHSESNSGFSGGHNQGMVSQPADFYLILNSDAVLLPGCLDALLDAAEANPQAGIVAPRLEAEDGSPQNSAFRLPTPWSELIRGAASGPVTRLLRKHDILLGTDPDPDEIGWVSFACVLLRRTMVEAIGPMDDGFFLYFEDTEYCWRAQREGWGICHVPQARAIHHKGGSSPVEALSAEHKRLPAYFYASRSRCFYRMHGRLGLLAANVLWHLGRGIAQTRCVLGASVPKRMSREAEDIWINFGSPLGPDRKPYA